MGVTANEGERQGVADPNPRVVRLDKLGTVGSLAAQGGARRCSGVSGS
jgi:hypothetical protein